jgi:tetratricopeptide (TPR) repeat protein
MLGRTVGHYEIVSRLGGGGMGVVYRAVDRKLGRTVAVKFLPPQWSHDEDAKQRFIREAQAASATHHPNICTIHDVEIADDGQLFIVMAYYEGPTLKQRLERGPLPVEEALDIATQLADGLAKAHAQGVLHRDIKPGNLILTEDGVRIVDFGLATFADAVQLTAEGSTLGTAAYMSPEQSRGEDADARTDVWAAGVVLYEMLSGHVPFRGSHAEAIAYAIRHDAPGPLRAGRPEIPEEVEQLVFRALHKDPAIRFQSGRELARALRQVRGFTVPQDLRTQVVTPPVARRDGPSTIRRRVAMLVAAVALLAGAAAWLVIPVERVSVAVAPVVNGTGFRELNGLEFTLAEELAAALADSRVVRVVSTGRVREIARRFRRTGDATGPDAALAIAGGTRADMLLASSLVIEGGAVVGRVDVSPTGGVKEQLSTAPVISGLHHETAQTLTLQLASLIEEHIARRGPVRGRIMLGVQRWLREGPGPRFATLPAAMAFERGLDAYERFEYAAASEAFTEGATHDPRSGLLYAWISRAALVSRRHADAAVAADRAAALLPDGSRRRTDRLFVEAVVAEAQRRFEVADAAYRALVEHDEQNAAFVMERAGYFNRRGDDEDAAEAYLKASMLAPGLARADLELCRLYSPRQRLADVAKAKQYADGARKKYEAAGWEAGVAQAEMCAVDSLRQDRSMDQRRQAAAMAAQSRATLGRPGIDAPYQFARAVYYQALTAYALNDLRGAIAFNEEALGAANRAGNIALVPFVLQNLAAANSRLGNRRLHIELSQEAADLYAAHGENERAATMQANAGATLIDFGDAPDDGFRLIENARKVLEQSRDMASQVFVITVSAAYHRYRGRHTQALQLVEQALALTRQAGLQQNVWSLEVDRSRSHFELGEYASARNLVVTDGIDPRTQAQAEIWLAQIDTRMGDIASARTRLERAASLSPPDEVTTVLLETASGELEYEADRLDAALPRFRASARAWGAELPHARSVEALAYVGLLTALRGNVAAGRTDVQKSLERATLTGRLGLAARCRVFLARIALGQQQADEAIRILNEVPADVEDRTIGPELRAQVLYWKAQALTALGRPAEAENEIGAARGALETIRRRLPPDAVPRFDARVDIRRVLEPRS